MAHIHELPQQTFTTSEIQSLQNPRMHYHITLLGQRTEDALTGINHLHRVGDIFTGPSIEIGEE